MMSKVAERGDFRLLHAAPQDFCTIFRDDMNLLYSLAFLLTGNRAMAEQCFESALDDCLNGAEVFPDRARSWSRRAIVKQAIQRVNPAPDFRSQALKLQDKEGGFADIRGRLTQLPAFERFVFAMAVLERYSIYECAALLSCGARDVEQARARALQFVAGVGSDLQMTPFTQRSESALIANVGAA